jgi:hypothetical protein
MTLCAVRGEIKAASLSNSAKLLAGYMKATGVHDAKELADAFGIPLRTIQRLKLDIACATDGAANSANSAMGGVSESANSATDGVSQKEISPTPPKEKTTSLPRTTVETNNLAQRSREREAALPRQDLNQLSDRLIEACNGSLDNPVNCQGLLNLATPMMWMNQGCDLELDIIPTLTAAGKKHHGKRIRSWDYFSAMISETKSKRERGLPVVEIDKPATTPGMTAFMAALERRKGVPA